MFTGPLSESRSAEIFLHDINAEAFEEILSFMYTGELLITEDNVQTLLPVANHLQMTTVKEACCEFLQSKVLPTNCLGIQRFADIHACPQLFKFTKKFTQQHFTEVLEQGEEYLDLTVEQLIEILDSDDLCVSEENIFHAVTRWIRQEPDTRSKHAAELFSRVRFALHPKEELLSLSQSENFLRENPWCKDYLIEALSFHLLTWEQKKVMDTIRSKPRTAFSIPKSLVVIGGQAPKAVKWVQTFNFTHNSWATNSHSSLTNLGASSSNMGSHLNESLDPNQNEQAAPSASQKNFFHFPDLPARRSRFGVTTIGNKIYAVGGFNGALRLRSMEIFDIHKQTWQSGTNMEVRRSTLGVTSLNGKVYAIGGFDGVNGFKSAETYDPSAEQWTQIANMSVRRSSVCCTEMNEKIYAIGGYDGIFRRCLSSVERYDPKSNKWSSIPDMTTRRSGACAVSISGKIYVVGGHDGPLVWNTCETFSEETGTWQKLADLNVSRRNAGAVVYQDRIFIVGGDDGNTNLTSVEYYDPNENIWRLLPCQMPHGVCYAGVVLMTSPFFF